MSTIHSLKLVSLDVQECDAELCEPFKLQMSYLKNLRSSWRQEVLPMPTFTNISIDYSEIIEVREVIYKWDHTLRMGLLEWMLREGSHQNNMKVVSTDDLTVPNFRLSQSDLDSDYSPSGSRVSLREETWQSLEQVMEFLFHDGGQISMSRAMLVSMAGVPCTHVRRTALQVRNSSGQLEDADAKVEYVVMPFGSDQEEEGKEDEEEEDEEEDEEEEAEEDEENFILTDFRESGPDPFAQLAVSGDHPALVMGINVHGPAKKKPEYIQDIVHSILSTNVARVSLESFVDRLRRPSTTPNFNKGMLFQICTLFDPQNIYLVAILPNLEAISEETPSATVLPVLIDTFPLRELAGGQSYYTSMRERYTVAYAVLRLHHHVHELARLWLNIRQ
ncbi:hypothetical protein CERSUDRAFT_117062 [Gelatoporia subvermispora B]|uniref:Uncharacterized protein n=1 Tax=Ceriporiopsis subvermispora (strain B) TaxID=914234 RepID=M2PFX7_CERS8|nr:hypothetical protein CERSUDRAFT_117062 [Gelatoporia subvermispora B]